jgi:hypothetical protein
MILMARIGSILNFFPEQNFVDIIYTDAAQIPFALIVSVKRSNCFSENFLIKINKISQCEEHIVREGDGER